MLDSIRTTDRRREVGLLCVAFAFVFTATLALSLAPFVRAGTWDLALGPWPLGFGIWDLGLFGAILIWLLCTLLSTFTLARTLPDHDPYLLPLVYFLSGWGLLLIWRLEPYFGLRQAIWLIIATILMIAIVLLPGDLRWLRRYRYTWLFGGLILTALTFIFGVNPSGFGERLWLGCCGLYLQPAEVLKLLLTVFLASYLADRREPLFQTVPLPSPPSPKSLVPNPQSWHYFFPLLLMWGFSILLLISQRDLGMSTLFFAVFLVMLYLASGRVSYVILGLSLLALAAVAGYYLFDVVRLRVEAWWNPWLDPSGRSFQIVQSLIAFANGDLLGRGPGLGAPTLIPVAHSDFIFSTLGEEWGLIGVVGAIGLQGILIFRGIHIAIQTRGAFQQLLAGGLAALIGLQALLIMGGVTKLIPLTGVTLPFLSYGGSSLVTHFCMIGLLLRLSSHSRVR
jgi:cell division protein FtsW (lipid II flippase)